MTTPNTRSAGQIIVDQLRIQGTKHVFCVPGESYLPVLDALYDSGIDLTVCRQEGGACMMAEANGKLTGRPGICMVTRGPGVANAFAGIHIAKQDSTPLIVFVGQIDTAMREREAFQEVDYKAVFSSQCKWVTELDHVERIPEIIARAFHVAMSGRPGPVVIALPEDMLAQTACIADAIQTKALPIAPSDGQLDELTSLLQHSKKPLIVLGGSQWTAQAVANIHQFAEKYHLPVAVEFRRQMLFSADSPSYVGDIGLGINPYLAKRLEQTDTILLIGGRMSEVASQAYTSLAIPRPQQTLIHVHPDSQELNRVYQAHLAINATPELFSQKLAQINFTNDYTEICQLDRQAYLNWSDLSTVNPPGRLQMTHIMSYLNAHLSPDTIMTNGAGNYATWLHRFYRFKQFGTQLAPTSGSMGYGLPAAVGAKRLNPNQPVVCFAGDGCFLMHGQEFATAVQYGLAIIVLVFDNGMYGTIRMHQENHFPGRVSGTDLINPDFAAYAQAFGGYGQRVETNEAFADAFEQAVASGKPAIIHCLIDPQAITPSRTLAQLREAARQPT